MGLVFVLLLGEIDLSAGFTAGDVRRRSSASPLTRAGWPLVGRAAGLPRSPVPSSASLIGLLVARLGIPSFVVTLAMFLALQGVLLHHHRRGRHDRDPRRHACSAIMNNNLPGRLGWILFLGIVVYGAVTFRHA